jgi:HPt (histidine-containing phosphotransfer) domain-containing protein
MTKYALNSFSRADRPFGDGPNKHLSPIARFAIIKIRDAGHICEIRFSGSPKLLDSMRTAAHTMKSASANLGAFTLAGLCRELEMKGRNGAIDGILPFMADLEEEYGRVRLALERELERRVYHVTK